MIARLGRVYRLSPLMLTAYENKEDSQDLERQDPVGVSTKYELPPKKRPRAKSGRAKAHMRLYLFDKVVGVVLLLDGNVHIAPGTEMDSARAALGNIVFDFADL